MTLLLRYNYQQGAENVLLPENPVKVPAEVKRPGTGAFSE